MGSVALNTTIESTFATAWGTTTPVAYDNVAFTQPSSGSWVALKVRETDSTKITLGVSPQYRRTVGTVFIEVFTPVGAGAKAARTYCDSIKAVFRDLRVSGVQFFEADVFMKGEAYFTNSGTGVPATSQQYQAVVAIPFKYDEVV